MTLSALGWTERRTQQFVDHAARQLIPGRVVGEHRTHYRVATDTTELSATITTKQRGAAESALDLPGVGDFVALRLPAEDSAVIELVLPRSTALIRKASGEPRPQLLAANVDAVFIVMALDRDFNLPRLERYLALARASRATPVVVANKSDLADDLAERLGEIAKLAPDTAVHAISARASGDISALEPYFTGNRTVALVGSSGVGKSTLTNRLLGRVAQRTQEIRAHDSRGRHTTTHRQLFLRPDGGSIMDTPGIREVEVWIPTDGAAAGFEDIEALALSCRFRNCQHNGEPGCAVREAVERRVLDAERVVSYLNRPIAPRHWER